MLGSIPKSKENHSKAYSISDSSSSDYNNSASDKSPKQANSISDSSCSDSNSSSSDKSPKQANSISDSSSYDSDNDSIQNQKAIKPNLAKFNPLIALTKEIFDQVKEENNKPKYLFKAKIDTSPFEDYLLQHIKEHEIPINTQINEEMEYLNQNLPSHPINAIFVVRDSKRVNVLKALISGSPHSPYAFGLFTFEVTLSDNYPQSAPIVELCTGINEVRFSPSFSENGRYKSTFLENWSPEQRFNTSLLSSNLYNLLIGIQGLTLSTNIIQNEPGFDNALSDSEENIAYSNFIKFATINWGMILPLKQKSNENYYQKFVLKFFKVNKENIKKKVTQWLEEAKSDKIDYTKPLLVSAHNPQMISLFAQKSYLVCLEESYWELLHLLDNIFKNKKYDSDSSSSDSEIHEESKAPVLLREASQNDPQPPESNSLYFQILKDFRFNTYDIFNKGNHICIDQLGNKEEMANSLNRYTKDVKVLSQHLPCELTGAVFVVMDTERMDLMKALISGTEDTPYAHGLYEFHIACPGNYPKKPPIMKIATTGKGTVRFNPNLYNNGYVCLSIINTWEGDPSERWNPGHSNILQVLLSIQVLVMDNQVIQKEPEYENLAVNSPENIAYCNIVKYNNAKYAILEMIKNPPEEFKEVIWRHFSLKRNAIMKTLDAWIEEAKSFKLKISNKDEDYLVKDHNPKTINLFRKQGYYNLLVQVRNEILNEIDKLEVLGEERIPYEIIEIQNEMNEEPYTRNLSCYKYTCQDLFEAGGFKNSLFRYLSPISHFLSAKARFQEEVNFLLQNLPCTQSHSIFVISDSERWDLLRVLISGPSGTDYANGLYLFDIVCTSTYPDTPPQVILVTNGRCKVKFHQNITESGEIIVPLLTGKWSPENHILDLLLEIQELFRTNYSIESENVDKELVEIYRTAQAVIRYNNLFYAIIDHLKYPLAEFSDLIFQHFEFKSKEIMKNIEKFIDEAENLKRFNDEILPNSYTIQIFQEMGYKNLLQLALEEISGLIVEDGEKSYCEEGGNVEILSDDGKNYSDDDWKPITKVVYTKLSNVTMVKKITKEKYFDYDKKK